MHVQKFLERRAARIIDKVGHNGFDDFCTFGNGTGIIGVAQASGLGPLLESATSLDSVDSGQLADASLTLLDWPLPRDLNRLAPTRWTTPAGRSVEIDYSAEGGPRVECKVQEAYGLSIHPSLADGRIPLTIALLSPAFRPVAVTRDLPAFWRGGYNDMRKDMKGRYPKHDWPDDPQNATPTSRSRSR